MLRILQIVTLTSGTGAFGGPVTVAVNQCRALRAAGHEVELLAARDETVGPDDVPGVRTFRRSRWNRRAPLAATTSLSLFAHVARHGRRHDVAHVHMGRDLLTVFSVLILRLLGVPYVVQTHGTVRPKPGRPVLALYDRLVVRPNLRAARAVFSLSPAEDDALVGFDATVRDRVVRLLNGVELAAAPEHTGRTGVTFCSRLHVRKRPTQFVAMAAEVHREHPDEPFTVVGPDGGELAAVEAAVDHHRLRDALTYLGPMAHDDVARHLGRARVMVLPSVREPMPMVVLESLAANTPVVVTRTNGFADMVESYRAGLVVDEDDVTGLALAVGKLLADEDGTRAMADRGREMLAREYSIDAVRGRLEGLYAEAAGAPVAG